MEHLNLLQSYSTTNLKNANSKYQNCSVAISKTENFNQLSSCNLDSTATQHGPQTHGFPEIKNYPCAPSYDATNITNPFASPVTRNSKLSVQYAASNHVQREPNSSKLPYSEYRQHCTERNKTTFSPSGSTGVPSPNNASSGEDEYCTYQGNYDVGVYGQNNESFMQQLESDPFHTLSNNTSKAYANLCGENSGYSSGSQAHKKPFNYSEGYDGLHLKEQNSCSVFGQTPIQPFVPNMPKSDLQTQIQREQSLQRCLKLEVKSEMSASYFASGGCPEGLKVEDLAKMDVKILNKRLSGVSKNDAQVLKQIRRTVKNREYARICREKRVKERDRIRKDNDLLQKQVKQLKKECEALLKERNLYKCKYEQRQTNVA